MPTTIPGDDVQHSLIWEFQQTGDITAYTGTRVFPNVIPTTVQHQPCVVVSVVDVNRFRLLGAYGPATSFIQIDSYGDIKLDVNALSKACKLRLLAGGTFGNMLALSIGSIQEFDLPSGAADQPADKSDRWRFRRALRCEIEHCEDEA